MYEPFFPARRVTVAPASFSSFSPPAKPPPVSAARTSPSDAGTCKPAEASHVAAFGPWTVSTRQSPETSVSSTSSKMMYFS